MLDLEDQQLAKASHFVERLIALKRENRLPDLPPLSPQSGVAQAKVRQFIQLAGRGRPGGPLGPTPRWSKFMELSIQQLEDARVPEALVVAATPAIQALIVREFTDVRQPAEIAYQQFEPSIPYVSL